MPVRSTCDTPCRASGSCGKRARCACAHATLAGPELRLAAFVGLPDGSEWIRDELTGSSSAPETLAAAIADRLRVAGAAELLARATAVAS